MEKRRGGRWMKLSPLFSTALSLCSMLYRIAWSNHYPLLPPLPHTQSKTVTSNISFEQQKNLQLHEMRLYGVTREMNLLQFAEGICIFIMEREVLILPTLYVPKLSLLNRMSWKNPFFSWSFEVCIYMRDLLKESTLYFDFFFPHKDPRVGNCLVALRINKRKFQNRQVELTMCWQKQERVEVVRKV